MGFKCIIKVVLLKKKGPLSEVKWHHYSLDLLSKMKDVQSGSYKEQGKELVNVCVSPNNYSFFIPVCSYLIDGILLALVIVHSEFIHLLNVIQVRLNCFKPLMKLMSTIVYHMWTDNRLLILSKATHWILWPYGLRH